jgi:hypothetical protein
VKRCPDEWSQKFLPVKLVCSGRYYVNAKIHRVIQSDGKPCFGIPFQKKGGRLNIDAVIDTQAVGGVQRNPFFDSALYESINE